MFAHTCQLAALRYFPLQAVTLALVEGRVSDQGATLAGRQAIDKYLNADYYLFRSCCCATQLPLSFVDAARLIRCRAGGSRRRWAASVHSSYPFGETAWLADYKRDAPYGILVQQATHHHVD